MLNETLLMSPIVWWIDWTGCIANHKGFWRFACKFHQEANSSKLSKHWLAQLSESSRESWEAFKGRGCLWSKRFFLAMSNNKGCCLKAPSNTKNVLQPYPERRMLPMVWKFNTWAWALKSAKHQLVDCWEVSDPFFLC